MKKSRLAAAVILGLSLALGAALPSFADGMKVVTLGADLSAADQQKMMNYFKADPNEVQIIYITNQDEREHLGAYVPIEQIGTRTVSCAYVKPTTSGGIKVRTANLNWVTGNMIASTLSTSGVKNCEVIAACPFSVSGTGALTGIQMAYEVASGEYLDTMKKQIATEEIVVTGNLAAEVGKSDATNIVNKAKMEVIEHNVTNTTEITNIVTNIAEQNNVNVNSVQLVEIVNLLQEIANQNYNYEDVRETLEHVDENVSAIVEDPAAQEAGGEAPLNGPEEEPVQEPENGEGEIVEDSILEDIDESILGDDVAISSTEDQSLEEQTYDDEFSNAVDTMVEDIPDAGDIFANGNVEEIVWGDEGNTEYAPDGEFAGDTSANGEGSTETFITEDGNTETFITEDGNTDTFITEDGNTETFITEDGGDGFFEEEIPEDNPSGDGFTAEDGEDLENAAGNDSDSTESLEASLSEQAASQYKKAKNFCKGEYEGDSTALKEAMGADFEPSVTIKETGTAKKLSSAVSGYYLKVLAQGTLSYESDGMESYFSTELNMMDQYLKKLFGIDGKTLDDGEEDILVSVSTADRSLLYKDTIKFFQKLYGEEQFEDEGNFIEETEIPVDNIEETANTYTEEYPEEEYVDESYVENTEAGYEDYSYEDTAYAEEGFIEEYDGDF